MQLSLRGKIQTWKYRGWRVRTWARFAFSRALRDEWRIKFRSDPQLTNARHYADNPHLGHEQMAYDTLAGFYNGEVKSGFMTAEQARIIYKGEMQ